jgi:hypothetical protein
MQQNYPAPADLDSSTVKAAALRFAQTKDEDYSLHPERVVSFHNGEEAFYALDDPTIELPDGKKISVKAGNTNITVRDVPQWRIQSCR